MANQEHLDILKQGVQVWNQWRKEHAESIPYLSNADLYIVMEGALEEYLERHTN